MAAAAPPPPPPPPPPDGWDPKKPWGYFTEELDQEDGESEEEEDIPVQDIRLCNKCGTVSYIKHKQCLNMNCVANLILVFFIFQ